MPSPLAATALPAGWGTLEGFPLEENSPPEQDLYENVTDLPHSVLSQTQQPSGNTKRGKQEMSLVPIPWRQEGDGAF